MSIFREFENKIRHHYEVISFQNNFPRDLDLSKCVVELPRDETHGDLACNIALILAKPLNRNPREIAELFVIELEKDEHVLSVDVAGPGFVNIKLDQSKWGKQLEIILFQGLNYGKNNIGSGQNINIEFVSANPTGPLHAAHARGAILGDVLANLLSFCGYNVTREYYINDAGSQIITLSESVYLRYREVLGEKISHIPEGLYPGDYLIEIAEFLATKFGDKLKSLPKDEALGEIRTITIATIMKWIEKDLDRLGVRMDVYSSENDLVAQKSDKTWTYFASDVAYHYDKLRRTEGKLIDILGADHSGYVKRMTAAVQAMSGKEEMLKVKQCGLVTLLDNGQPVKMSKRAGTFVTLSDVIDAVGADVMRFVMLTRRNDQPIEFDYAKVTEKSRDNPVFYVQYAHARARSVLRQNKKPLGSANFSLLTDIHEIRLIKILASWSRYVEASVQHYEPHRIAFYLMDLASAFHGLWNAGRDNPALKFIHETNDELTIARMQLVEATALVTKLGLNLLSITALEVM